MRNYLARFVFLVLCMLYTFTLYGRDYPMLHYTTEDGLPSNMVYDAYEAPDGLLWIGTDKGVSVFNGLRFRNYTIEDGLADNECLFFYPDSYGRLWIGTLNGKLCYYEAGKFHNEFNTPWLHLPFTASNMRRMEGNEDSSFIVYYRDYGFLEIDRQRLKVFHYPTKGINNQLVRKISANDYAVYVNNEIYMFFDSSTVIHIDSNSSVLYKQSFIPFFRLRDFRFNCDKSQISCLSYLFESIDINAFFDIEGKEVYPQLKSVLKGCLTHQIYNAGSFLLTATNIGLLKDTSIWLFKGRNVHFAMPDRKGSYWIGTAKDGLYRVQKNLFETGLVKEAYEGELFYANASSKYLFYGTRDKIIFRLDKASYEIDRLFQPSEKDYSHTSNYHIIDDDFYLFSYPNPYVIRNINSKHGYRHELLRQDTPVSSRYQFVIDSNVYLCNKAAIHVFTKHDLRKNKNIKSFRSRKNYELHDLYGFSLSPEHCIWYSSVSGVYKMKDTQIFHQPQFGNLAFRESLFAGGYMLGITHDNRLVICNHYEGRDIVVDTVQSVRSCIWDKFHKINDSIVLLKTNDYYRLLYLSRSPSRPSYRLRVVDNSFIPYQAEYVHTDSTHCYFFKNGDITIYPLSVLLNESPLPRVKFERLIASGDSLMVIDSLHLDYAKAQQLRLYFTPVSFNHKDLVYEYSVGREGSSPSWQSSESEELNLLGLGYGRFLIRIRARTLSGDYSSESSFVLSVTRPYWASWWFIGFCSLLGVSFIVYVARLGVKRNLKRKEGEVRFLRSEYKALNALMNPHFIFNSLNSLQALVNNHENVTASSYIRTFSDLIRQNMNNISNELIPLSKEILLVEHYLAIEQMRFKEKLRYSIRVEEDVETDLIHVPPLLIQPMVENSIKHGILPKQSADGFIDIHIYEDGGVLSICIQDNGVGMLMKESSGDSYALRNIEQRLMHLRQIHALDIDIRIENRYDDSGNIAGVVSMITIRGL